MLPTLDEELRLTRDGHGPIAGVDEVGRGAWAGPLVAAAVVLPPVFSPPLAEELLLRLAGVRDSKTCTADERATLAATIREVANGIGVGIVTSQELDRYGLTVGNCLAMRRAVEALPWMPGYLLLDWVRLPELHVPQRAFARGDATSLSIAAASIIAKVERDAMMTALDATYAGFDFARHKGYGTPTHRAVLRLHGPLPVHRYRFAPVHAAAVAMRTYPLEAAPEIVIEPVAGVTGIAAR
ncbi:MAG: ribonuclease HII [Thermomicrobiales bacterium]